MRDSWTETTLGQIAEYINGYPFKPDDLGEEGTPVIRIKQLLDPAEACDKTLIQAPDRCVLQSGDIVFSWSGTLAVRVWGRERAYLNQHLFRVVEKEGVLRQWLPLVLDHSIRDLSEMTHGTTMKHVTKQTLLPHRVQLPPLSEQKRIVDVMASVDAYIAALQQQADDARSARNGVLHELLTAGGADWTETTLGEVAALGNGGTWGADAPGDGLVEASCLRGTDLADLIDDQQPNAPVRWLKESELTKARCVENMILIETSGSKCGRSVLLTKKMLDAFERPVVFSNFCRTLRIDPEQILSKYAELWFSHAYATGLIPSYRATSAMPNLDIKSLLRIEKIRIPPLPEQKRIVETVTAMDDVVSATEQAVRVAQELRAGLLSTLLLGEHEIPDTYDRLLGAA